MVTAGNSASMAYNDISITSNGTLKLDAVTLNIPTTATINNVIIPSTLTVTGSIKTNNAMYVTGSINVTGSVNIKNKLNLTPQTPLPTGTLGDLAVSGSNHLFFYNGTSWVQII